MPMTMFSELAFYMNRLFTEEKSCHKPPQLQKDLYTHRNNPVCFQKNPANGPAMETGQIVRLPVETEHKPELGNFCQFQGAFRLSVGRSQPLRLAGASSRTAMVSGKLLIHFLAVGMLVIN